MNSPKAISLCRSLEAQRAEQVQQAAEVEERRSASRRREPYAERSLATSGHTAGRAAGSPGTGAGRAHVCIHLTNTGALALPADRSETGP